MGSRQTRRSNGERTRSSNSQIEESNSTVNEDTESENETDLVSVLAFLLRSGQARIVQANTEGGGGIHLIHRLSSSDTDDDDDDDDFEEFSLHGNVPSPQTDPNPSTASIDESLFKTDTLLSSGQNMDSRNICARLHARESYLCHRQNFSPSDKASAYAK